MKKTIFTLMALALLSFDAFGFNGTIGRSTALDFSGAVESSSVEKQFLNVKNSHSASIPAGATVVLDVADDDGAGVIISTDAGLSPLCVMVKACAVGALCSCQNYGIFDAALFDVTGANAVAGKRVYMSTNNAGYLSARGTDLATEAPGGVFYDAASASGSIQVFIKM